MQTIASSWWFQPIWKIRQIGSFSHVGVRIKNLWNHHLGFYESHLCPESWPKYVPPWSPAVGRLDSCYDFLGKKVGIFETRRTSSQNGEFISKTLFNSRSKQTPNISWRSRDLSMSTNLKTSSSTVFQAPATHVISSDMKNWKQLFFNQSTATWVHYFQWIPQILWGELGSKLSRDTFSNLVIRW